MIVFYRRSLRHDRNNTTFVWRFFFPLCKNTWFLRRRRSRCVRAAFSRRKSSPADGVGGMVVEGATEHANFVDPFTRHPTPSPPPVRGRARLSLSSAARPPTTRQVRRRGVPKTTGDDTPPLTTPLLRAARPPARTGVDRRRRQCRSGELTRKTRTE